MTQHPACIVPPRVHLGACWGRTPSRPGTRLVARVGQANAGAVSAIDVGTGGQPSRITPRVEGLDLGPGLTAHVLKTGDGLLVQALRHRCRRDVHRLAPWGDLCRPWPPRRRGLPPDPQGHQSQNECARHLRRALDNAGATGGGVAVVGSKQVCSHGARTACTRRPSSLLGMVVGRVRSPIFTPRGDFSLA